MGATPDLDSRAKVARKAKVALGAISNMASGDSTKSAPNLASIERVAAAFKLQAWQLLYPDLEPSNPPVAISSTEKQMYDHIRDSVRDTFTNDERIIKNVAARSRVPRLIGRYSKSTLFDDEMGAPPDEPADE